ncbi:MULTISPECIES: DUF559 domain-containing protein [Nocardiaceae]|uniref:Very-short-patch-repair endonuclease n=1 Tax=Rhodococcoides corynebacterioides TaxID=53972 RepID=A0ABS2KWJ9_9NOCA|nr:MULTISPECIES: DUF559 domain-containing protein [Rhodococcus]MBM7416325.1 very-short-patch-repair endonuclease [Rhodococcus corynebacterioides]MBP1114578.1 very-short-patch-repair endonuclease [Rhodococcus sp. PvP016]
MVVLSRAELLRNGIGRGALSRRVRSGSLHRLLPAVYSTTPPSYEDRCRAVVLWKPAAVLSHDTAAWLWGLLEVEPVTVHATVPPSDSYRGPDWSVLHRRRISTVVYRDLLPVVTAEQCFVDVATTLDTEALERFVDHALTRRVRWRAVAQACDAARGMHGVPAVREQLRRCCPRTLSEPERLVARALARRNFPLEINGEVGPYYGDLVDRRGRVIVEIDGREFHIDPHTFTRDRVRQNDLVLSGWLVLRYSVATVMAQTDEVVDQIVTEVRRRRRARA